MSRSEEQVEGSRSRGRLAVRLSAQVSRAGENEVRQRCFPLHLGLCDLADGRGVGGERWLLVAETDRYREFDVSTEFGGERVARMRLPGGRGLRSEPDRKAEDRGVELLVTDDQALDLGRSPCCNQQRFQRPVRWQVLLIEARREGAVSRSDRADGVVERERARGLTRAGEVLERCFPPGIDLRPEPVEEAFDLRLRRPTLVEAPPQAQEWSPVAGEHASRTEVAQAVDPLSGRDESGLEVHSEQLVELCSCELVHFPRSYRQGRYVLGVQVGAVGQE